MAKINRADRETISEKPISAKKKHEVVSRNEWIAARKTFLTKEKKFAHLRAYRNNIDRYTRLLKTELSDLERQFIERRLAEDQSAMERLVFSIFPVTPEPPYWRIVIRQSQVAGVTVLLRRRTGDWFAPAPSAVNISRRESCTLRGSRVPVSAPKLH